MERLLSDAWQHPALCLRRVRQTDGVYADVDIGAGELLLQEPAATMVGFPRESFLDEDSDSDQDVDPVPDLRVQRRLAAAANQPLETVLRNGVSRFGCRHLRTEEESGEAVVECGGSAVQIQDFDEDSAEDLYGLWTEGSRFNHSCAPNCSHSVSSGGVLEVRTGEAVRAGSELTVARVSLLQGRERRRRMLAARGIDCSCPRCSSDEDEAERAFGSLRCVRRFEPLAVGSVVTDVSGRQEEWRHRPLPELKEADVDAAAVTRLHSNPDLDAVPGFITAAEAEHLLSITEARWKSAALPGRRTSSSVILQHSETPVVAAIERRIADLCGVPLTHVERFGCVKYAAGEYFKLHHDGCFRPQTVFLYLNSVEEGCGGRTSFPRIGVACRPRAGWALRWSNASAVAGGHRWADGRMSHESEALTAGVKYGVNVFINDCPVRQFIADPRAALRTIKATGVVPPAWSLPSDGDYTQLLLHALASRCEGGMQKVEGGAGMWRCDACGECRGVDDWRCAVRIGCQRQALPLIDDPVGRASAWCARYGIRHPRAAAHCVSAAKHCARTGTKRSEGLRMVKRAIAVLQTDRSVRSTAPAELAELYTLAAALSSRQEQLALLHRASDLSAAAGCTDSRRLLRWPWARTLGRALDDVVAAGKAARGDVAGGNTSGGAFHPGWLRAISPLYHVGMGCENMGTVLYSIVRFTKPRQCLEVGAGHTTGFLLQGLEDNAAEMRGPALSTWLKDSAHAEYESGTLHCVDNCTHPHTTAHRAVMVASELGIAGRLKIYNMDASEYIARASGVMYDLVWLDGILGFDTGVPVGKRTETFIETVWPHLRPGGLLLVHSTLTNLVTRSWVESLREKGAERMSLLEPHKMRQNSFTALQKREEYHEPIYTDLP